MPRWAILWYERASRGAAPKKKEGEKHERSETKKWRERAAHAKLAWLRTISDLEKSAATMKAASIVADARQPAQAEARRSASADAGEHISYIARPIAPCRRAWIVFVVGRWPIAAERASTATSSSPSYDPTGWRSVNPFAAIAACTSVDAVRVPFEVV